MGAMQTFSGTNPDPNGKDLPKVIDEVDYIISVSGGGYSAGARLLAMQKKEGDSMAPSKLSDRYAAGSPEFEHMRKHSSYIADTPAQLLDALTKVAKNMILSLVVLFAPAVVLGVLVGLFYDQVPLAAFVPVPDAFLGETDNNLIGGWTASMDPPASGLVDNSGAVWLAVVVPAALGIVMFSFSVLIEVFWTNEWAESCRYATRKVAMAWTAFTLLMLLIVAGLPALIRACAALANDDGETAFVLAGSTASAVVVLNYFGVLAAMAWKNKAFFSRFASKFGAGGVKPGAAKALPRGVFQLILVVLTLVVLAAAWLATVGGVGAVIFYVAATNGDPLVPRAAWTTLLVALVAIVVVGCPDVTSFSLHPFYRRRLARAFAVRRRNRAGRVFAEPYPDKEGTRLDEYGSVGGVDIPEFVFAAAATVSGEMKPAPGLNVVSFALGHNYIGGPDVGWMKTGKLFEKSTSRIKRDLTVEAAVAVSGAAFASAMGRQNNGYQTLLAVSGARLGTWLPNPNYLRLSMEEQNLQAWSWPQGLPRFRGFTYLLREVFGINPDAGRLVQVTDGGHYENLGLVEALRRRCTLIYCIDGSGDTPPRLGTLADALRLAKYELGVDIVFDHGDDLNPSNLVPGSGTTFGPDDQFEALNDRITKGAVIRGQIYYPDAAGLPKDTGATLIYAKAVLSEQCPLWLQTYAGANDIFPHDSTSDQWFNEGQFAAYTELGRLIAAEALTAVLSASAAPSDQQDTAS
ncbi:hypothetical protein [Williamsia muralis]|nr:hypothetical protein [Williamsia marianensis]